MRAPRPVPLSNYLDSLMAERAMLRHDRGRHATARTRLVPDTWARGIVAISRRALLVGGASVSAGAALLGRFLWRPSTSMYVAAGKVDITPPPGTYMGGYGLDTPRTSTGVHRPLFARCVIFWDRRRPRVMVTADVLAFGRPMHQAIRHRVTALGVDSADFILTATHTHNGPVLTRELDPYISYGMKPDQLLLVESYSDRLIGLIVQLVSDTLNRPRARCTLDYQVATETFARNREGLSHNETDVPVLVARSRSGDPLVVLFSYGCHPVSAGQQTLFDPDYPGKAVSEIEAATGGFAQFVLGPAGDQNPAGTRGWDLADHVGGSLGRAVSGAIATPGGDVGRFASTTYHEITIPLDITENPAHLADVRRAYKIRLGDTALPGYLRRHAEVMIAQIDVDSFATSVPVPLQAWRLTGDPGLRIAFTGGEPVSAYGVHFRSLYGGTSQLLFGGYANEVPAYLPTDELLRKPASYAGGFRQDFPGVAAESMAVYGCIGHFRGKPTADSPDGVEQIIHSALSAMLDEGSSQMLSLDQSCLRALSS